VTTYGDTLAGMLNGSSSDGSGLWALLLLFVGLVVLIAAVVILVRVVNAAIDGA
jgi:hypothetical protein